MGPSLEPNRRIAQGRAGEPGGGPPPLLFRPVKIAAITESAELAGCAGMRGAGQGRSDFHKTLILRL
jgi:hypothetical protein